MNIETFLVALVTHYPPWALSGLLLLAALSFLARHRAHIRYGRIREYRDAPLGMAATLGSLALLYLQMSRVEIDLDVTRGMVRLLLSLLSAAAVLFNWGGIRVAWRDLCNGIKGLL